MPVWVGPKLVKSASPTYPTPSFFLSKLASEICLSMQEQLQTILVDGWGIERTVCGDFETEFLVCNPKRTLRFDIWLYCTSNAQVVAVIATETYNEESGWMSLGHKGREETHTLKVDLNNPKSLEEVFQFMHRTLDNTADFLPRWLKEAEFGRVTTSI